MTKIKLTDGTIINASSVELVHGALKITNTDKSVEELAAIFADKSKTSLITILTDSGEECGYKAGFTSFAGVMYGADGAKTVELFQPADVTEARISNAEAVANTANANVAKAEKAAEAAAASAAEINAAVQDVNNASAVASNAAHDSALNAAEAANSAEAAAVQAAEAVGAANSASATAAETAVALNALLGVESEVVEHE